MCNLLFKVSIILPCRHIHTDSYGHHSIIVVIIILLSSPLGSPLGGCAEKQKETVQ